MGLVTPLATGVEQSWARILAGESGIRRIQKFNPAGYKTQIAGEVLDFNSEDWIPKKKIPPLGCFHPLRLGRHPHGLGRGRPALAPLVRTAPPGRAAFWAWGLAGCTPLEETVGDIVSKGPQARVSPFFIPKLIGNMGAGEISMEFSLKGAQFLCGNSLRGRFPLGGRGLQTHPAGRARISWPAAGPSR